MTQTHELVTPEMRTTSRVIAEKFGKLHKNVLRDIENTLTDLPEEFGRLNFEPSSYLNAQGKQQPQYQVTRDGFTLITMGFTGKAAIEWKIRFIEAFNAMEAEIRARSAPTELPPGEDMGPRDWLALIREARLLGGVGAGRRMWALSPLPPLMLPRVAADAEAGRACLAHVLGFAEGDAPVIDLIPAALAGDIRAFRTLAAHGLRSREEGLFVANSGPAGLDRLFAGTPWAHGAHRAALLSLPGARLDGPLTLLGVPARGVTVPFAMEGAHV